MKLTDSKIQEAESTLAKELNITISNGDEPVDPPSKALADDDVLTDSLLEQQAVGELF